MAEMIPRERRPSGEVEALLTAKELLQHLALKGGQLILR